MPLPSSRNFQIWFYHVTHGRLLIRSPNTGIHGETTNIDLTFHAVVYLAVPRLLNSLSFVEPFDSELRQITKALARALEDHEKIWVLKTKESRALIVASHLKLEEHTGECMLNPFENE
ncbi:hypothetical protein KX729_07530 [Rhizobium sp. XQZ8]|uniref:hypothetical protein n=1 Tax=Rhizobium populisoli TaxID=2859785 RepID=UPI001CA4EEED|nr:hypothetical protein [Rhizobium populisoli]MBW6421288.1 hypothetical protein [Rhizobium populisoli]